MHRREVEAIRQQPQELERPGEAPGKLDFEFAPLETRNDSIISLVPEEGTAVSIAGVERDTGLPKDTLRVWERRHRFPAPLRDAYGERLYPRSQVDKPW